jgi:hypothetical protein
MSLVFSSPAFAQFLPSGTTPFIFLLIFYLLALNASIPPPFLHPLPYMPVLSEPHHKPSPPHRLRVNEPRRRTLDQLLRSHHLSCFEESEREDEDVAGCERRAGEY